MYQRWTHAGLWRASRMFPAKSDMLYSFIQLDHAAAITLHAASVITSLGRRFFMRNDTSAVRSSVMRRYPDIIKNSGTAVNAMETHRSSTSQPVLMPLRSGPAATCINITKNSAIDRR